MELWSKNNVIYTIGKIYTCICKNKVISPFFFYKPTRIFSLLFVRMKSIFERLVFFSYLFCLLKNTFTSSNFHKTNKSNKTTIWNISGRHVML